MSTETKWRIVWASWLAAGIVAETVALASKDDHAPLSHHLRRNTHILGKTHLGRVALLAGATWLHRHLYRPMIVEAQPNGGDNPRVVLRLDGIGGGAELRSWIARAIRQQNYRRNGAR